MGSLTAAETLHRRKMFRTEATAPAEHWIAPETTAAQPDVQPALPPDLQSLGGEIKKREKEYADHRTKIGKRRESSNPRKLTENLVGKAVENFRKTIQKMRSEFRPNHQGPFLVLSTCIARLFAFFLTCSAVRV